VALMMTSAIIPNSVKPVMMTPPCHLHCPHLLSLD
jgi:hypothetical protein